MLAFQARGDKLVLHLISESVNGCHLVSSNDFKRERWSYIVLKIARGIDIASKTAFSNRTGNMSREVLFQVFFLCLHCKVLFDSGLFSLFPL